ncbi:MAG: carboxypeptidase regulatory-like domain-containing protein [Kofleriaceae bacterium]
MKWAVLVCVLAFAGIAVFGHSCLISRRAQPKTSAGDLDRNNNGHARAGWRQLVRASIRGTVLDAERIAIPHARVCAFITGDRALPRSETLDPRCTTATELGVYQLSDLLPTEYQISSVAEGYLPGHLQPFVLHAGEHRESVDVVLQAGGVLVTGTVSDLGGGPISHARVHAYATTDYESTASVETDDAGVFRMTLWAASIGVSAVAENYNEETEWGVAPGTFSIVLTPASSLSGTVVDARTHAPAVGAVVELYSPSRGREVSTLSDVADEQGRFRFDRLGPDRYAAIARASHGYGRSNGSVRVGLAQHVDDLHVVLEPAADIQGKLVVAGTPPTPCEKPSVFLSLSADRIESLGQGRDDGVVRIEGVLPGTYQVGVQCQGHELIGEAANLDVRDRDITGLEWKFVPVARGKIRGRVLDSAGKPVAGAQVSCDFGNSTTKSDGTYELAEVPIGTYELAVTTNAGVAPAGQWTVDVPTAGTVTKDLTLAQGGGVLVNVVDSKGGPVEGAFVMVAMLSRKSAKDGTARFENLPAGDERVFVDGAAVRGGTTVAVRAGHVSTVRVVADPHVGRISGVVIGANGLPRSDAFVVASLEYFGNANTHDMYNDRERVLTGVDGAFSLGGLTSGLYSVRAYEPGGGETIVEHVQPGSPLRMQLKATGSIAGTVHAGSGAPNDFKVRILETQTSLSRDEHFYRTGGRYHFDDLPAGTYQVTANDGELEGTATAALPESGHLSNVDVTFDGSVTIVGRVVDVVTKLPVEDVPVHASLHGGRQAHEAVSDRDGRFTVAALPSGTLDIQISKYGEQYSTVYVSKPCRGVVDLGDVFVAKQRYKDGDKLGEIGFEFATDTFRVDEIDSSGPAARSGLVVGDVVTSIDGIGFENVPRESAWSLFRVPVGTTIRLGLADGRAVTITTVKR